MEEGVIQFIFARSWPGDYTTKGYLPALVHRHRVFGGQQLALRRQHKPLAGPLFHQRGRAAVEESVDQGKGGGAEKAGRGKRDNPQTDIGRETPYECRVTSIAAQREPLAV